MEEGGGFEQGWEASCGRFWPAGQCPLAQWRSWDNPTALLPTASQRRRRTPPLRDHHCNHHFRVAPQASVGVDVESNIEAGFSWGGQMAMAMKVMDLEIAAGASGSYEQDTGSVISSGNTIAFTAEVEYSTSDDPALAGVASDLYVAPTLAIQTLQSLPIDFVCPNGGVELNVVTEWRLIQMPGQSETKQSALAAFNAAARGPVDTLVVTLPSCVQPSRPCAPRMFLACSRGFRPPFAPTLQADPFGSFVGPLCVLVGSVGPNLLSRPDVSCVRGVALLATLLRCGVAVQAERRKDYTYLQEGEGGPVLRSKLAAELARARADASWNAVTVHSQVRRGKGREARSGACERGRRGRRGLCRLG